jgi:glycosyltransferase involved in cell wall biosynthesis
MPQRSSPLHVLQVIHSLHLGGAERVVRDLATELAGVGFRSSVCCLDALGEFGEELRDRGLRVDVLGRRTGLDLRLVWLLAKRYRELGVHIVHAHQYTPYFYAATARLVTPWVRVVFTEHGRHYPDHLRRGRALYNQLLRRVTTRYTAVSHATRDSLRRFERMPSTEIQVIYNGVDLERETAGARAVARMRLGIDATTPVVLSVGRLDRVKDFATLMRAAAVALRTIPDLTVLIAGAGDNQYRAELIALTEALQLEGHVRFLGARRDVADLLAVCDVFALTSVSEGASMTILEAMAASCPVLATAVGGNIELVVPGMTGLLVPAGNVPGIAAALVELLTNTEKARALGAAGRRRVAERFSRQATFAAYRRLYEEAVAG